MPILCRRHASELRGFAFAPSARAQGEFGGCLPPRRIYTYTPGQIVRLEPEVARGAQYFDARARRDSFQWRRPAQRLAPPLGAEHRFGREPGRVGALAGPRLVEPARAHRPSPL